MAILPHDDQDEQAVIGSIFRNRDAIVPIAPWLLPEHFYREGNGWVYAAMLECYRRRQTPDLINVSAELKRLSRLDLVGGLGALSDMIDRGESSYSVEDYAKRVLAYSIRRQGISSASKIASSFYLEDDPDLSLAEALRSLTSLGSLSTESPLIPIGRSVDRYYDRLARVQNGEASALGIMTGYRDLDDITGGLHSDDLTILAARPSVGKTSLALSLGYNIAEEGHADVLIFSLEMGTDQLTERIFAMETRIDLQRIRLMRMGEQESRVLLECAGKVASLPIYIADFSAMTAQDIRLSILRHIAQHNRPVVAIIDYLQLMGSTRQRENRVQDVSEISRGLKNMARELHIPVLALSQLSRGVESRESKIPMLSDLRDSGSIEQDADIVLFIYREELYKRDSDRHGVAELYIAKHRSGPLGVIPLRFDPSTTRFTPLSYRDREEYR